MTPEEQNAQQVRQNVSNYIQAKLWAYKRQKQQIDAQYEQQQSAKMENDTLNLYKSWIEATDKATKERYNIASRTNLVAEMISSAAKDNWYELTWNAYDVVDSYLQGFPQNYQAIYDFTRWNQDPEDFAVQMWWMQKPEEKNSTFTNILWWLTESALWIPKFAWKIWADIAWATIKAFGWDEERANAARDTIRWAIDKIWFGDEESGAYQATNIAWDIAQLFIPWVWWAKGTQLASKLPKLAKYITKGAEMAQKYPKIASLLKLWWQWAIDTIKYNAINQEYTSPEELTAWSLLNIAFGKWGEVINKVGGKALDTLWIKGIMNTSKAKKAIEAIQKEWEWPKTIEDLAWWFNARWFKGTNEEIVAQLEKHWEDARQLKLELLSSSNNKYKSEEATEILEKLQDYYKWSVWQKADYDRISKLIKKWDMYTPSELDNIQHELSQSSLNPFKESKFWETKDARLSDILGKDYNKVKKLIEDIGEKEWLWNIKALNNEIVVANKMLDWIKSKSMAEEIASWLKAAALPTAWAAMWYIVEWDLEWMLKRWAGTYALKLLNSTPVRTYVSSAIQNLKWAEKVRLTKWLNANGKQALTDADSKVLAGILESAEWETRNEIINTIMDIAKEWARLWTVVGWAEIVDYATEDEEQ